MTAQLQFRRGTAAAHSTFVGAVAEPTYSTDDARLRIHDGTTAGGISYAKVSELSTQASTGTVGRTRYASTTEAVTGTSTATALTPKGNADRDVPLAGNATLSGGYRQTTYTISSSTAITPNGMNGQLQYYLNHSVTTLINVPSTAADTAIDIWVTNSTSPGTITFSSNYTQGSTSVTGALSTGNSANGMISIRGINGKATYALRSLSTF